MDAKLICKELNRKIKSKQIEKGTIHSIFDNTINIIDNNKLISVYTQKMDMFPNSILTNMNKSFLSLGIVQGMEVTFNFESIKIKEAQFKINLKNAKEWNLNHEICFLPDKKININKKLKKIEEFIVKYGSLEGIAPLIFHMGEYFDDLHTFNSYEVLNNNYTIFIQERFFNFIKTIINYDFSEIKKMSTKIAGFGPGLTPSTDDFITGLMIGLNYMSKCQLIDNDKVSQINKKILEGIIGKTTTISENMIYYASLGKGSEGLIDFIVLLLTPCEEDEFFESMKKVFKFGETSGTDMICGIYLAIRVILNQKQEVI